MSKHSMRTSCAAAGAAAISVGLGLVVAATGAAGAGAPTAVALNPPPPDSYTCTPVGNGTRCLSDTTATGLAEDSGIVCGTGAHAFGVMDSATRRVKAERWYDADGNLVKRVRANLFSDAHLSNAVTGASVSYDQHDVDTDLLAVPGDLDTATTYSVESFVAVAPGHGAVLVNKGRSVYAPDGTLVQRTGRRDFDAYFGGDDSVMAELCAALGD